MSTDDRNGNELNEPAPAYRSTHLRVFHSFQEAADAEAADAANQSPIERLRETVELILRVYGVTREQLAQRKRDYTIRIIRSE